MNISESYDKKLTLVRSNTFENEILIVDGQGRSGKNLVSVLLTSMNRVEKMRLDSNFDYIPRYYFSKNMSREAAVVALHLEADEKYYYNSISRDVNFRPADYSGVLKQGNWLKYFIRLFLPADEKALERIINESPIFQEMTHDALHVAEIYFQAFSSRLKLIHVFRDPVENILEQHKRGFGARIGSDPREFQLTYGWNGYEIPLTAIGREDEYLNGNSIERLVVMVDNMFRANLAGFYALDEIFKNQVMFIEFEDLVTEPEIYLQNLEKFIGEKFKRSLRRILKREKCPRSINPETRDQKRLIINDQIGAHYKDVLDCLLADYDLKPWKGLGFRNE
jgi:hypothetical protein